MSTIIFGTKRLGQVATVSSTKYPDRAVVTVEGTKGAKKSRRILFNKMAAELLGFETGDIQEAVFGSLVAESGNKLLISNTANLGENATADMTIYKTSKNAVSYDDSSEKGKAITSSHMCGEISNFLDLNNETTEFELVSFDSDQIEAFEFAKLCCNDDTCEEACVNEIEVQAPEAVGIDELSSETVLVTNNGTMNGEELTNSIQEQVARDEANAPVLERKVANVEDYA
tara:strand:- start:13298 stop:13984 length:687 start_codon:yes stop_codon:yes gene_type:complete